MKVDKAFAKEMDEKLLQSWQQSIQFKKNDIKFCQDREDWYMVDFHKDVLKSMEKIYEEVKKLVAKTP